MKYVIFTADKYINMVFVDEQVIRMCTNNVSYIDNLWSTDSEEYKKIKAVVGSMYINYKENNYVLVADKENKNNGKRVFSVLRDALKDTEFIPLLESRNLYRETPLINVDSVLRTLFRRLREYSKVDNKAEHFKVDYNTLIQMLADKKFRVGNKQVSLNNYPRCVSSMTAIPNGDYLFVDIDIATSCNAKDTMRIFKDNKEIVLRCADDFVKYGNIVNIAPKQFYKYADIKLANYRTVRVIYELKTQPLEV